VKPAFDNPFRPGAGHRPPYLAGRNEETKEFSRLLGQKIILENLVLTGLRGVGKTVLLESFKPMAIRSQWRWVGTDLSESSSIREETIVVRLLTDLAVVTADLIIDETEEQGVGFGSVPRRTPVRLDFDTLIRLYKRSPGLPADKLKKILLVIWAAVRENGVRGIVFAYDEAQNLADHASKDEFPLSLLLDVFQSIQRQNVPFMLVLVGLPTLFPKLVQARTFSERMFRVVDLDRLSETESREAIQKPIQSARCPVKLDESSIKTIVEVSGGYPYFLQFICKEVYDSFLQGQNSVPVKEITRKLDSDFFSGRWARATDRQRDLLTVIASLETSGSEFTVSEIAEKSKLVLEKPFSPSHINQMLVKLAKDGLIYKNRYGRYSFAVPLLDRFIDRQIGLSE